MADPGTVTVPDEGIVLADPIVITRENTYNGVTFTLGSAWSSYLAHTAGVPNDYYIYFTAKERYTEDNTANFFDVLCTVSDQATGEIQAVLDATDTDIISGKHYWWQIQLRSIVGTTVKTPMTGQLIVEPRIRDVS